jgi:hypothetical protein
MTRPDGIARTVAAMVATHDVSEALAQLVEACANAYPAAAVAILVQDKAPDLELLSSTTHAAAELELLQIQAQKGPCVDAIRTRTVLHISGPTDLERRWGHIGQAISNAGYDAVHAYPMTWREHTFGGLNIFLRADHDLELPIGQMFADLATLAVLQTSELLPDQLRGRVHEAVVARTIIEQAKGVLAHRDQISMNDAYDALRRRSAQTRKTLTQTARDVVESARVRR